MQHKEVQKLTPKITVVGVGGAGGNAVNNMINSGLQGCEFLVCNTDAQALEGSLSECKLQLGVTVTGGLGAGAKPDIGRAAAEESLDDVMQYLEGSNMAFITAGMGGGTGTGAAPVIAKAARDKGILTVGVVTKPFHFEGTWRMKMAEDGIEEMQGYVDTLIVIPNQNLFRVANEKTTFAEAFKMADSVLQSGVRGVTDLMVMPGLINLDFADIRSAMLEMGKAMMGTGESAGDRRAVEAAESAINNPLLDDVSMQGARGVIINVTGGLDMTLFEVDEACNRIRDEVDPNANIIFGSTFDESLDGLMRVSVVATGIDAEERAVQPLPSSSGINTSTHKAPEKKLDRVQPNTDHAKTEKVQVPSGLNQFGGRPYMPAAPVTAGPAVKEAVKDTKDEPDSELFEQPEFNKNIGFSAEAPESKSNKDVAAPKATIYNESFIPPKPVEPAKAQQEPEGFLAPPVATSGLSAPPRAQEEVQVSAAPTLELRPPVPGGTTPKQPSKRTPSLFDRFTNPFAHKEEKESGQSDTGSGSASSSGGFGSLGLKASPAPNNKAQGSLNIDTPAQSETPSEDELDIPAFLRRQAN
jgi:cell division protein FtsZ